VIQSPSLDMYAGMPVADFAAAVQWYERLLGSPPSFFATDTEAIWILAERRSVYVVQRPQHAGHAMLTLLVDDLDTVVDQIAERGIDPTAKESYPNDVRKVIYHDPDGNEFGFGGVPQ
jgi:hypothetical protein